MEDPFYSRAVVVICEHSAVGSFGIIVNKGLDIELPEEVINLKEIANPHVQMKQGGMMQPTQMMLLHSSPRIPDQTLPLCDGVYLGGDLAFLQEAINDANGPYLSLCFGHAGWGPGQLEREFLHGQWFLHPASSALIFSAAPDKAWQAALRAMGGKYTTLSTIPEDLSLN